MKGKNLDRKIKMAGETILFAIYLVIGMMVGWTLAICETSLEKTTPTLSMSVAFIVLWVIDRWRNATSIVDIQTPLDGALLGAVFGAARAVTNFAMERTILNIYSDWLIIIGTGSAVLIGDDDSKRLFAELFADPDRPEVRPQEAYQAMLSSIQPGWTLRLMQVFWPDPEPRVEIQNHVKEWSQPEGDGPDILHQGLILATQEYPLPFVRRTILEFVLPGDEDLAWWDGLTGLCAGFGYASIIWNKPESRN